MESSKPKQLIFLLFSLPIWCLSLFMTIWWWISNIIIQLTYPFISFFCSLYCSINRSDSNTLLLNIMKRLWVLRTQCCQAINAETWKIRIFVSMLISEEIAVTDLVELKQELVDSKNSIISLNHELRADIEHADKAKYFRVKIELAIENAESKALDKMYRKRVNFVANKQDISEYYLNKEIDNKVKKCTSRRNV